MVYTGRVEWYNDVSGEIEVCRFFTVAESYTNAMIKCTDHFGEADIEKIILSEFSPYDFVEFWGNEEKSAFKEAEAIAMEHTF